MLAVFESAARLGSFTAAAAELGLTQSGVSRHVGNLERAVGLDLFRRSANRVRLTADGRALLASVQRGFGEIDQCLRSRHPSAPTFLLAANPGFAQQWLVPHLDTLQAVLGDVDLRLRLFDRDGELHGGTDGPADEWFYDAAIHLMPIAGAPEGSRILFGEVVLPVATPEFASSHDLGPTTRPDVLLRAPKLHLDERDRRWLGWTGWFRAQGLSWSPARTRLSYNNYALVMNDALAGRGVALAWRGLVDDALSVGTLVPVGVEVRNPDNAYQLLPGPGAPADLVELVDRWLAEIRAR